VANEQGSLLVVDWEATGLKPEADGHRIACVGLAWGTGWAPARAVAIPWAMPGVLPAVQALLTCPGPKAAAGIKFESRWAHAKLGIEIRNFVWDTQLAGHWVDPQEEGVVGLKFQAYAELGFGLYDQDVKPYLEANGNNGINQIHLVPMPKLLRYCALDSLLEYVLARKQMKQNKMEGVVQCG
jgi:hypothetical protein